MAADKAASKYEDVFEDGEVPKEEKTVHRIRANSTIMHVNKILGSSLLLPVPVPGDDGWSLQMALALSDVAHRTSLCSLPVLSNCVREHG